MGGQGKGGTGKGGHRKRGAQIGQDEQPDLDLAKFP